MSVKHVVLLVSLVILLVACNNAPRPGIAERAAEICAPLKEPAYPGDHHYESCIQGVSAQLGYPTESTGLVYPDVVVVTPAY